MTNRAEISYLPRLDTQTYTHSMRKLSQWWCLTIWDVLLIANSAILVTFMRIVGSRKEQWLRTMSQKSWIIWAFSIEERLFMHFHAVHT